MQKLNTLDMVALLLVIVGGLYWGLFGLAGFNFVDTIEFKPDYAFCRAYGDFEQKKCYLGWSYVKWDVYHNCYNGIIILSNPKYLIHELGHIYEHCELKRNISTEEFANNFKIK